MHNLFYQNIVNFLGVFLASFAHLPVIASSIVTAHICITLKTNNSMQEAKVTLSQNLFLFPYSLKVLLAEVKIFHFYHTKKQQVGCQNQRKQNAIHRVVELLYIQACSLHSVFCFYLIINITLMMKPVSNSEQTNKCKEVLGEQRAYHKEVLATANFSVETFRPREYFLLQH